MEFTLNSTLGDLMDHPQAKAVLEEQMPGITSNPMVGMARGLTLNTILSMPQAAQFGLSREKVETMLAEVNKRV